MKKLLKVLLAIIETASDVIVIVGIIAAFFLVCKNILEPLSGIITATFVLLGTITTLGKRESAILSIGGIIFYLLSWPVSSTYGIWPGMIIWSAGIIAWFSAVFRFMPKAHNVIANV